MMNNENRLNIKFIYRIIMVALFFLAFTCSYWILDNPASAIASDSTDWSWTSGTADVYSSNAVSGVSPGGCDNALQSIGVYPLIENKMACINNSGTIRFGYYYEGRYTRYVISYPLDNIFYQIDMPCAYVKDCLYVPGSDALVMKQNLISNDVKSLVIYKNVSERIKLTFGSTLQFKYYFDSSEPEYIFQNSSGYAWPIGGLGVSDNGRWLAVELRERGIGLLDMKTMEMKRVTSEILRYGVGYNPSTELAVSNSGKQVVQMGFNAWISFFDLSEACGDIAGDDIMLINSLKNPCQKVNVDYSAFINRFFAGIYPRFSNDGAELSFFAMSYSDSSREVVLRASDFSPQRVEYLAMGDSFTSGEGEFDDKYYQKGTNTEYEKCHVSSRSYPFKIAMLSNLDMQFVKSVACSGARTNDVIDDGKKYLGQGGRLGPDGLNLGESEITLAQTNAKYNFLQGRIHQKVFAEHYQPRIITIGIGGNDVGLVEKLKSCVGPDECRFASDKKAKKQVSKEIKSKYSKFVETYETIHKISPKSKIFVIGYPKAVSENGNCGLVLGRLLSNEERKFFNESIKYLNQVIESAAMTVGVTYVDNYGSFGGGVICGPDNEKAINDFRIGDDIGINENYKWTRIIGGESFHPNPNGFSLIADNFMNKIGNIGTAKICPSNENIRPVATPAPEPSVYWENEEVDDQPALISKDIVDSDDVSSDSRFRSLHIESYSLRPNSILEVSIYSEKTIIGEYVSDEIGGFDHEIQLPKGLDYGFHSIHIVGKSFSGEDVELYQSISYYDKSQALKNTGEQSATDTKENYERVVSAAVLSTSDSIGDSELVSDESNFPAATVKGAADQRQVNKSVKTDKEEKDFFAVRIVAVALAAMLGCGLLIIVFRNKA